ncbi:SdpI family protein [Cohnella terricola]|uniref:DUF1648 domain-containing protein n=1 Tax=Cohnella terricola TaxID=1289167 RepID=A0A559J8B4_9BACL|nr:SdpI family protein [Cohnella terricola]TVX96076.1 DUF1648 domain-containing protein [Cohnella terricola]
MTNLDDNNNNAKVGWSGKDWTLLGANALLFIVLFLVFNHQLPDQMASHYNINGEQDRMMAKWSFWLLYAATGIALPSILTATRFVDPRKNNYSRFEGYFYLIRWAVSLFLHAVMLLIILDNAGYKLPTINIVVGGIGVLWMILGNRMGQVRSNFFIGIRTPWALMDEQNWRLTHRLGARVWFAAGLIMFVSAWFVSSFWIAAVILVSALGSALIPAVYSYMLYRRASNG